MKTRCVTATRTGSYGTAGSPKNTLATKPPTKDGDVAASALDTALAWCAADQSGPVLRALAKTLTADKIRPWPTPKPALKRPAEAANPLIKAVRRSGRGVRNLTNYRLRILLAGGPLGNAKRHTTTSPSEVGRRGLIYG